MKKRIVSIIALMVCAAMLVCLIGCNSKSDPATNNDETATGAPIQNPTDTPSGDGNDDSKENPDPPVALTEDQLFVKMKEALAATKAHTGDFYVTIDYVGTQDEKGSGSDTYKYETKAAATFDAADKKLASSYEMTGYRNLKEMGKSTTAEKFFTEGSVHYQYIKSSEGNNRMEKCYTCTDDQWSDILKDATVYSAVGDHYTEGFGNALDAADLTTLKANYTSVLSKLIEAHKAKLTENGLGIVLNDPIIDSRVTLSETDGVMTMEIYVQLQNVMSNVGQLREAGESVSLTSTLYAKDGKITGFKIDSDYSDYKYSSSTDKYSETVYDQTCEYKISYEFNQECFDSVTANKSIAGPYAPPLEHEITISVNGYTPYNVMFYVDMSTGASYADILLAELNDSIGIHEAPNGYTATWYTDAAYTTPLNLASIRNADDILAIKNLYLKVTADNDKAIIIDMGEYITDVPAEYLTVLGPLSNSGHVSANLFAIDARESNVDYFVNLRADEVDKIVLYVNGQEISESQITNENGDVRYELAYQNGNVYFVFRKLIWTEASYDLATFMFDF